MLVYRPKNSPELVHAFNQKSSLDTAQLAADSDYVAALLTAADARGMSRSEISDHPSYGEKRAALLEIFDRWHAELLMPLVYERAVRGFVCFGSKWSGGEYGAEDFRLLAHVDRSVGTLFGKWPALSRVGGGARTGRSHQPEID